LAAVGIRDEETEADRECRDVGEGLSGPDRERRQHGENLALEACVELRALLRVQALDIRDDDVLLRERRAELAAPERRLAAVHLEYLLARLVERLLRCAAVRQPPAHAGRRLAGQPGD